MAFDITPYIDKKPSEVSKLIREGVIDFRRYVSRLRTGQPYHPSAGIRGRF